MIAISFLGLGKKNKDTGMYEYEQTKYEYEGKIIETCYFPYAVKEFTTPEKLAIIMTEKASIAHSERLKEKCDFDSIEILEGKTEKEMWDIFSRIAEYVKDGEELIVDITHGFRSQPVVLLACLIYLKALKNVKLLKILYAAFEARDNRNVTPVFDLKPFLDLMDWSYGVYEFTRNGNTKEFRTLLSNAHSNTYLFKEEVKAKKLKVAGNILEEFSNAMSVVNINDMLVTAKNFKNAMPDIIKDTKNISEAKPFGLLIDRVKERMNKLGMPYNKEGGTEFIRTNAEIIRWYLDTEQYQQAITLMTEIIITVKCILNFENPYSFENRKREADIIGKEIEKVKNKEYSENELSKISILYEKLGKVRNEINHGGMKEEVLSTSGTNQIKRIKEYFKELEEYIEEELKDAG